MRERQETWLVLPHVQTGEEIVVDLCMPVTRNARITTVSDAILLSLPYGPRLRPDERSRRIFDCLHAVFAIQRGLLALSLRTRGGVSVGGLIHKAHLVVGDALVKSHALESRIAIYPRVVIDDSLVAALIEQPMPKHLFYFRDRLAHIVRQDADRRYFVDYLSVDPIIIGTSLGPHIVDVATALRSEFRATPDDRIRQKLGWMISYIETTAREMADKSERRTDHAEVRFSNVFYRSNENLRALVEEVTGTPADEVFWPHRT